MQVQIKVIGIRFGNLDKTNTPPPNKKGRTLKFEQLFVLMDVIDIFEKISLINMKILVFIFKGKTSKF